MSWTPPPAGFSAAERDKIARNALASFTSSLNSPDLSADGRARIIAQKTQCENYLSDLANRMEVQRQQDQADEARAKIEDAQKAKDAAAADAQYKINLKYDQLKPEQYAHFKELAAKGNKVAIKRVAAHEAGLKRMEADKAAAAAGQAAPAVAAPTAAAAAAAPVAAAAAAGGVAAGAVAEEEPAAENYEAAADGQYDEAAYGEGAEEYEGEAQEVPEGTTFDENGQVIEDGAYAQEDEAVPEGTTFDENGQIIEDDAAGQEEEPVPEGATLDENGQVIEDGTEAQEGEAVPEDVTFDENGQVIEDGGAEAYPEDGGAEAYPEDGAEVEADYDYEGDQQAEEEAPVEDQTAEGLDGVTEDFQNYSVDESYQDQAVAA